MRKWHPGPSVGLGRPAIQDMNRIATSLRQFHISLTRLDHSSDTSSTPPSPRPQTNRQRSAIAGSAVRDLFDKSSSATGIDARALGASPSAGPHSPQVVRRNPSNPVNKPVGLRGNKFRHGQSAPPSPSSPQGGFRVTRVDGAPSVRRGERPTAGPSGRTGATRPGGRGGRGQGGRGQGRGRQSRREDKSEGEVVERIESLMPEALVLTLAAAKSSARQGVAFKPSAMTREALVRGSTAILVGSRGAGDVVEERLVVAGKRRDMEGGDLDELARRLIRGDAVKFRSDEERDEVVRIAGERARVTAEELSEKKGKAFKPKEVEFVPMEEKARQQVVAELVKGGYTLPSAEGKTRDEKILGTVHKALSMNGTYVTSDEAKVVDRVKGLLALQPPPRNARPAPRR